MNPQTSPETWRPIGVEELEPAAWEALYDSSSTAVTAGPGAGKTEFLAQRATYLLQTGHCPSPQKILAISYKRESAVNLKQRVTERVPEAAHRFESLTFDAFTKSLFDRFNNSLPRLWRLNDGDYDIAFFQNRVIKNFLTQLRQEHPSRRSEVSNMNPGRFLSDIIGNYRLPKDPTIAVTSTRDFVALAWWWQHYLNSERALVDFTMVNRLADLIVRTNPQILRGLHATYPFVFIDEFQDTTAAQITFLNTAFGASKTVVTAVGDKKQHIMSFAGALVDALERYEAVFQAKRYSLTWNFRSSIDLVNVQNQLGANIDPVAVNTVSKAHQEPGHTPVSIWYFPNTVREAFHLAAWIADDIRLSGRTSADFALVARQKVQDLEPTLTAGFKKYGLSVRNDNALYGKILLQDLLKHDITQFILGLLTLAIHPMGHVDVWTNTLGIFRRVYGDVGDENAERRLSKNLSILVTGLRKWLRENPVESVTAELVVNHTARLIGCDYLAGFIQGQNTGDDLILLLEALTERMQYVMRDSSDWGQAVDAFEDEKAIPLMTIHRSKGLEYHTVVVLGMDAEQWWAYDRDPSGSHSTLFVGLSRAAQRVIFTVTKPNVRESLISPLFEFLDSVGPAEEFWQ